MHVLTDLMYINRQSVSRTANKSRGQVTLLHPRLRGMRQMKLPTSHPPWLQKRVVKTEKMVSGTICPLPPQVFIF